MQLYIGKNIYFLKSYYAKILFCIGLYIFMINK